MNELVRRGAGMPFYGGFIVTRLNNEEELYWTYWSRVLLGGCEPKCSKNWLSLAKKNPSVS